MNTLKSFTKEFFHHYHPFLSETYPGISYQRLTRELEDFGEDLNGSYFPNMLHSRTNIFFKSLLKGIPLEYIGKKCYFFRSYFEINENVFIPRQETEILVEEAVKELELRNSKETAKILDVGTGSGNIILSILQEYTGPIDAVGVDISKEALELSQRNAFCLRHTFSKNKTVQFIHSDRLSQISQKFCLIVSNPPYIKKESDQNDVHPQVAQWEPSHALYLKDDSYQDWFEKLFFQINTSLVSGGVFLMEGHENHLGKLKELASQMNIFSSLKIKTDYTLRNRFLILRT